MSRMGMFSSKWVSLLIWQLFNWTPIFVIQCWVLRLPWMPFVGGCWVNFYKGGFFSSFCLCSIYPPRPTSKSPSWIAFSILSLGLLYPFIDGDLILGLFILTGKVDLILQDNITRQLIERMIFSAQVALLMTHYIRIILLWNFVSVTHS